MKVVILSIAFPEYTIQLANALAKQANVDVTIISSVGHSQNRLDKSWNELLDQSIHFKLLNYSKGKNLENIFRICLSAFRLVRFIRIVKPDVVHIQESGDLTVALALPFITNVPKVATIHDVTNHPGQNSLFREFLRRKAVHYSTAIIVHGQNLKQLAKVKFNLKKKMIYVIPHGSFSILKDKYAYQTEEPSKGKNLLFFGQIFEYKGLRYLIQAEPLISHAVPDVKIIIAGRGPDLYHYVKQIKSNPVYEFYDGFISNQMLVDLINRASVVVLPYIEASQSGIVPLAYTFGKPVIATDVGSIHEVLEDNETGRLIPPKNEQKLAEAAIDLLTNDTKRTEMGRKAFEKSITVLSWDNIAEDTLRVYKNLS